MESLDLVRNVFVYNPSIRPKMLKWFTPTPIASFLAESTNLIDMFIVANEYQKP